MTIHIRYFFPLLLIAVPALGVTIQDVCNDLGQDNRGIGTAFRIGATFRIAAACRAYEGRRFDPAVLGVIREMAKHNPANTLDSIEVSADGRFDATAVAACGAVAGKSTLHGRACLQAIRDKSPSPLLSQIVTRLAERAYPQAVTAFEIAGTAQLSAPLAEICLNLAGLNPHQGLECVGAIANKTAPAGAEQACLPPRTQSSVSMLSCVKNLPLAAAERCETPGVSSTGTDSLSPLIDAAGQLERSQRR